jgi:hypothetical protein
MFQQTTADNTQEQTTTGSGNENNTYTYQDYSQVDSSYSVLLPKSTNYEYDGMNYYNYANYQNYTYPYQQTFEQTYQDPEAYYWSRLQNNKTPEKVVMNDSGIVTSPEVEKQEQCVVTVPIVPSTIQQDLSVSENTSDSVNDAEEEPSKTSNSDADDKNSLLKPPKPYLEIIADAILSNDNKMMQLHEIYYFMEKKYEYFLRNINKSWRNSVRHNLSLNECFMKAGRGTNGKGNYWKIHPLCETEFMRGNFRRKNFKKLIRQGTANMKKQNFENVSPYLMNKDQSLAYGQTIPTLNFNGIPNFSNFSLPNSAYSSLLNNNSYSSTSNSIRYHPYNHY